MNRCSFRSLARLCTAFALAGLMLTGAVMAEDEVSVQFESANLLYEKGQFEPAARAYESLLNAGVRSAPLLFNAGNAWFKAGKRGRAVACWLQAEALEPRNDRIQINLEFVRKEVNGGVLPDARWPAPLRKLSLDEWAAVFLAAGWACFGLLAIMVWRPAWRGRLKAPAWVSGLAFAGSLTLLVITTRDRAHTTVAVVVTEEAVVRFGPLAASQSAFVARDGTEFRVVDRKDEWLRVADALGRDGWLLGQQVVQLRGGQVLVESSSPGPTAPLQAQLPTRLDARP